ncbi:prepilin peptidase [Pontibacterium sp.]|mgnify:CR=1 FL=1|jgi:prepilin peptidase CpaA|uniref:A24 family peptidase n=1 Tax=Pontibacterium sp. TaxID=2036026 RepID=UPI0035690B44
MLDYQTYDLSTVFLLLVLVVAALIDLRRNRIPNWLTFSTLGIGLSLQLIFLGSDGFINGLSGAGVGLALLLPFFLMGGMGAGDVKLMAAVGCFIGTTPVLLATAFSLLLAGGYALLLIGVKGQLSAFMQRYMVSVQTRTWILPETNSIARRRFPFALAIAGGTVIALGWYSKLDFYHLTSELSYQWQLLGVGQ